MRPFKSLIMNLLQDSIRTRLLLFFIALAATAPFALVQLVGGIIAGHIVNLSDLAFVPDAATRANTVASVQTPMRVGDLRS
jgi:hypothetical protein